MSTIHMTMVTVYHIGLDGLVVHAESILDLVTTVEKLASRYRWRMLSISVMTYMELLAPP